MSGPRVALVDYDMGNLRSVAWALRRLGARVEPAAEPGALAGADLIVLPGVGAFGDAVRALGDRGLAAPLAELARAAADGSGRPFLGVCLGLQLLFPASQESPGAAGLAVIPGRVLRFPERAPDGAPLKVPHMGWNSVEAAAPCAATAGLAGGERFYFVHSFHAQPERPGDVALRAEYGGVSFAAAVARGRLFAAQFHPEKSQRRGLEMLRAFLAGA